MYQNLKCNGMLRLYSFPYSNIVIYVYKAYIYIYINMNKCNGDWRCNVMIIVFTRHYPTETIQHSIQKQRRRRHGALAVVVEFK